MIINEEEAQFLRTLQRGKRLLELTISRLEPGRAIPGDVAWKLYDTYGYPLDLTVLMADEAGRNVDKNGFEASRKDAVARSQGTAAVAEDEAIIDVHAIAALNAKAVAPTDDSPKYRYSADAQGNYSKLSLAVNIK